MLLCIFECFQLTFARSVEFPGSTDRAILWAKQLLSHLYFDAPDLTLFLAMTFVALYIFLVGYFIESERTATDWMSPILFEFMSGTLYVSIGARLLYIAMRSGSRAASVLGFFGLMFYASTSVYVSCYRGTVCTQLYDSS